MDDKDVVPIHRDFGRWYREVASVTDETRLQARWTGVEVFARSANGDDLEALVRLVFRSRMAAAPASVQKIREAFKDADGTFEMSGNDREMEILAGSCLVALMEGGSSVGGAAALAITTACLSGARQPSVPMDLSVLAESAIDSIAEADRQRPDLVDGVPPKPLRLNFNKAVEKVNEQQGWPIIAEAFKLAATDVRAALNAASKRHSDTLQAVNRFVRIQDEELQMLWWLTGQRSWDYDCSFNDVPVHARPLVLAKELADSTEFPPGPPSAIGLLSRAGLGEDELLTVPKAINAAKSDWLAQIVGEDDPSPVSTPLHFAIKRQLETGPGDSWVPGWAAAAEVSADHAVSSLQLGVLFYRERLLRVAI